VIFLLQLLLICASSWDRLTRWFGLNRHFQHRVGYITPIAVYSAYLRIIPYHEKNLSAIPDLLTLNTDFVTWSWSTVCLHHINPVVRWSWWWYSLKLGRFHEDRSMDGIVLVVSWNRKKTLQFSYPIWNHPNSLPNLSRPSLSSSIDIHHHRVSHIISIIFSFNMYKYDIIICISVLS